MQARLSWVTMFALRNTGLTLVLVWLWLTCASCALMETKPDPEIFYAIPPVTYLREHPGYASQIVATLYRGEQVAVLSSLEDAWCRVQRKEGGQVGWMQRPLLSPAPVPPETYYVQAQEVPLRDDPQEEVLSRLILHRGDQVRKLAENQQGWWRVLVEKDKSLGWLPAAAVAASPPPASSPESAARPSGQAGRGPGSASQIAPKTHNFVATATLELHLLPLLSSQVVKVLQFNDKVEIVAASGAAWRKVKYPETGAQGWTLARFLSESPGKAPKSLAPKKKKAPKKPKPPDLKKDQPLQPEDPDPEVM
jgi:uncharacterized protein YgiM (DUF1202 family)